MARKHRIQKRRPNSRKSSERESSKHRESEQLWEERFRELVKGKEVTGSCDVTSFDPENTQLRRWVKAQRRLRAIGELSPSRTERLQSLGFDWNPLAKNWENHFAELLKFKAKHRHCNVSQGDRANKSLAIWVQSQRVLRSRGKLTKERIRKLREVGFDWEPLRTQWEQRFAELKRFRKLHGHVNVPANHKQHRKLSQWLSKQRIDRKLRRLPPRLVTRLNALGVIWDLQRDAWEKKLLELRKLSKEGSQLDMKLICSTDSALGRWLIRQLKLWRKGKLSGERVRQLNALKLRLEQE